MKNLIRNFFNPAGFGKFGKEMGAANLEFGNLEDLKKCLNLYFKYFLKI